MMRPDAIKQLAKRKQAEARAREARREEMEREKRARAAKEREREERTNREAREELKPTQRERDGYTAGFWSGAIVMFGIWALVGGVVAIFAN
jgi:hypothetical protein